MKGHWRGPYNGTNRGEAVLEIDDIGDRFAGCVYAYDADPALPATFAYFETSDKSNVFRFKTPLSFLHPGSHEPIGSNDIIKFYPGIQVPSYADVNGQWAHDNLKIQWVTDIGTNGTIELPTSQASKRSKIRPLSIKSWDDFKRYATGLVPDHYIFRGQSEPWRLRTTFHRTGRADLRRFSMIDIPRLHHHISAMSRHVFDLSNATQNGAFYSLIQHHGYPTPLLDWTYSPFIASYFAFQGVDRKTAQGTTSRKKIRIFVFNKAAWCVDFEQIQSLATRQPHFTILEALPIGNERMIPQQGLSSFTKVDDVESYIQSTEKPERSYLQVIDLPIQLRQQVMQELRLMGITSGSLFPGLDGACEEFRERFFPS